MQLAIDCTQKSSSMILLRPWIPDGFYALPKHNLFLCTVVETTVVETTVYIKQLLCILIIYWLVVSNMAFIFHHIYIYMG